MNHPPLTWNGSAFYLIELMTVIALLVLLMTLGGINLGTGSARLFHITGLMEQCRKTAILKRQSTALVMLSDGNNELALLTPARTATAGKG